MINGNTTSDVSKAVSELDFDSGTVGLEYGIVGFSEMDPGDVLVEIAVTKRSVDYESDHC